jgi:hypothetical protein
VPRAEVSVGSVFISYRREDSQGQARALFQDLVASLGKDAVFMDVDGIALGRDFREVLQERLATCELMLVLIGREWLAAQDSAGRRRLDNPADFVCLEIAAALKRRIPITPLLVEGAQMPGPEQLPESIRELAYRNGFELSHNRWDSDVRELMKRLGIGPDAKSAADAGFRSASAIPTRSAKPWLGGGAIAALVLAAGAWLYLGPSDRDAQDRGEAPARTKAIVAPGEAPTPSNAAATPAAGPTALERTHTFDGDDSRLAIGTPGAYVSSPFTLEDLALDRDFQIEFRVRSTRSGGSTRYGIAWNHSPDDFMLFTLHSVGGGYFSIGPGRSKTLPPFSRLAEGPVGIQAEQGFDALRMTKEGSALVFAINGKDVWSTTAHPLTSRQFAFWAADVSEASIRSYTLRQ